jgi:hypothetical protein
VLPTHEDAQRYRALNDPFHLQVLHEAELLQPELPLHSGALSFLDMVDGQIFLEPERLAVQAYWSGENGLVEKGVECITASPLRVVRVLD